MLEVRCERCVRRGKLNIDKLIDEHGSTMTVPDLRDHLAGDREHRQAARRQISLVQPDPDIADGARNFRSP